MIWMCSFYNYKRLQAQETGSFRGTGKTAFGCVERFLANRPFSPSRLARNFDLLKSSLQNSNTCNSCVKKKKKVFVCISDVISTHTQSFAAAFLSSVVSLMQPQHRGKKIKVKWMYFPDLLEQLIPLPGQTLLHLQASSLSDETRPIHNYIKR